MKQKVTLTFEVESSKKLTRDYLRKLNRRLRTNDDGGRQYVRGIIDAFYNEAYGTDSRTTIIYVALESKDKFKLEVVK